MSIPNRIQSGLTTVKNVLKNNLPHELNPQNYTKNPISVTKDAYAPSLTKLKKQAATFADSSMKATIDMFSPSDEAKEIMRNSGAKGIAAPGMYR